MVRLRRSIATLTLPVDSVRVAVFWFEGLGEKDILNECVPISSSEESGRTLILSRLGHTSPGTSVAKCSQSDDKHHQMESLLFGYLIPII